MEDLEYEEVTVTACAIEVGTTELPQLTNDTGEDLTPGWYYWFEYEGFPDDKRHYVGPFGSHMDALATADEAWETSNITDGESIN